MKEGTPPLHEAAEGMTPKEESHQGGQLLESAASGGSSTLHLEPVNEQSRHVDTSKGHTSASYEEEFPSLASPNSSQAASGLDSPPTSSHSAAVLEPSTTGSQTATKRESPSSPDLMDDDAEDDATHLAPGKASRASGEGRPSSRGTSRVQGSWSGR